MSSGDGVAASAASSSLAAAAASSHAGAAATSTTARGVPAKKREKLLIAQQQSLLAKQQDQPQQSATKAGAEHASSTPLGGVARTETTSQQQQVPTVEVVVPVPSFPALIAQQQSGGSNNVPSLFGANGQTAPSSSSASPSMLSPLSSVIGDSPSRLHSKHSLTPPSSGGEGGGKKRKRSPYRCQKCNKPKKGHICTVTDSVLKDRETVPTPTPMVLPKPSIGGVGQPYTLPPINSSLPSSPAPSSSSSVLKTGHLSSSSSSPTAPSSPAAHHSPMMLASVSSTSSTASSSTAATSILDGSEAAELFEQGSATTSGSQDPYLLPSSLSGMGFSTNSLEELFAGVPGSSFPIRGFSSTDLLLASMEPQDLVSTAYPQGMPLSGVGIPLTETNATFFLSWFDMAISSMRLLEIFLKTQRPSWRPLQTVLSHLRDERKTLRKWKKEFGEAVIEPAEGGQSIYSAATYPQHHWQRSEKAAIEEEDDEEAEDEEEEEQQKRSKRLRSSRRPTQQHKAKTTSNNSEEEEELEQEQDVTKIRQQKQQQRSSTSTSSTTPNSQPQRGP